MAKGSAFSRVLNYFRNADSAEAQACLTASAKIMDARTKTPVTRRPRKSNRPAPDYPRNSVAQSAAAGASE